ncbi:MAG TPA: DUF4082 domain-containing protein [Tepidisphaeraceae bacterium]
MSSLSARVRDLLADCATAAAPQVGMGQAVEPLESRQLLSASGTSVLSPTSAPAAGAQNVFDGVYPGTSQSGLEVGAKFQSDTSGYITGVRFYKSSGDTGTHVGDVWSSSGQLLAQATFTNESGSGWQEVDFSNPVAVTAGSTYVVSYHTNASYFSFTSGGLSSTQSNGSAHLLGDGVNGGDGVFNYGANSTFPSLSYQSGSYWVDAVFSTGASTTTGSSGSSTASTVYAASAAPAGSQQNINDGVNNNGTGGVEVGAKFRSDVAGYLTGVRFYKSSGDTGTHVGDVWSSSGQLLAQATFTNESGSGWQEVDFSNPVAVTAGSTYVISYHTTANYFSFTSGGLTAGVNNGSLHQLADGANGGDGVFSYGANSTFPASTYQSGSYWVDAAFSASGTVTTTPTQPQSVPPAPVPPPPVPASPPPPPPPAVTTAANAPTPVINLQGGNGQAEHSIFVNGLNSPLGDGNSNTATYTWNFGDPSSKYNTLTGWNAGHIYDNPGTYTITLTITNDLGVSNTATKQVTVTAANRKTIYVDTNGNDANSGLSPSQAIASPTRLQQVLDGLGDNNVTVLFARGETFMVPGWINVNGTNEVFGAYGSGANPVLMHTTGWSHGVFILTPTASQIVIENLTFDSIYTAQPNWAPDIDATAIYPAGQNITVRNDTFLNLETAMDCYQGPNGLLVENNSAPLITGLRGYFVWMNGTQGVVLGNTVVNSTRQHIMRSNFPTTEDWLIDGNNFTGNNNPADPGEMEKTTINIRQGDHIDIEGNTLAGATASFGPTDDMSTSANVSWIKFDGNVMNNAAIELHGSVWHTMVSNNLTNLGGYYPQIQLLPTDDMGRQMQDVTIQNNTGELTGSGGTFIGITGDSPAGVLTIKNNLFASAGGQVGVYNSGSVGIYANSANAVALFSHNVWAPPSGQLANNPGGVNYISATDGVLGWYNYLTAQQWNSLPNVQDDQFRAVSMPSGLNLQVPIDGQMAGAILPPPLT